MSSSIEYNDDNSSIFLKTKLQNEEFLNKISSFNIKQGKMIIAKYDWEHSPLDIFKTNKTYDEFCTDLENYLKERFNFLNFMAKYL